MTKQQARAAAKALRRTLDMPALGAQMADRLFALPVWREAQAVFAFASLPDEPDTTPILYRALAEGKCLYLPRCLPGPGGRMETAAVHSPGELRPGRYGIAEPAGPAAALPHSGTLMLIPCLAADRQGTRLGRGAGYYDRFLAESRAGDPRLLVCPAALIFDALPRDPWDAAFAPGEILTESGLY
ncbi:MAG: 5-formyltetrahydrofolate cyclo-ligase, partial [Gemmiger sp.]